MQFNVTFGKRLLFLLLTFILCYIIIGGIMAMMMAKGPLSVAALRIMMIMQDILLFIVPALATACIVTRMPADLLMVARKPSLKYLFVAICTLMASIPAMDVIIWLNQNIPLPAGVKESLLAMEETAAATTMQLMGEHTIPNLIISLLIVAVLAGFSEEFLFRGTFQRLMSTGGVNIHVAIWCAAFIFSAMHLQILGFVPRMLLGAFFGYTLYWTRSLWVPIILHILNNSAYIINDWMNKTDGAEMANPLESGGDYAMAGISLVLTIAGLAILHNYHKQKTMHELKSGQE